MSAENAAAEGRGEMRDRDRRKMEIDKTNVRTRGHGGEVRRIERGRVGHGTLMRGSTNFGGSRNESAGAADAAGPASHPAGYTRK